MKNRLIMLATCLLIAGELSATTPKTRETSSDNDVNAAAETPLATTQVLEEEFPVLEKTLGKRGAIERRMSDAQERRRAMHEVKSTTSGTVVPY